MTLYLLEVWYEYEDSDKYFVTSSLEIVKWWQNSVPRGTYSEFKLDSINFRYLPVIGMAAINELKKLGVEITDLPKI